MPHLQRFLFTMFVGGTSNIVNYFLEPRDSIKEPKFKQSRLCLLDRYLVTQCILLYYLLISC